MNWKREWKDFYGRKKVQVETNKKHYLAVVVYDYYAKQKIMNLLKTFS